MNIRPKLTVNTYTDNKVSSASFEIYNETLPDEIVNVIDCLDATHEIEQIIQDNEKTTANDYIIDIVPIDSKYKPITHKDDLNYCTNIPAKEQLIYLYSRPVTIHPLSEITINDDDISIVRNINIEKIPYEFIDDVIRPKIYEKLVKRKQYQKNQNLKYLADLFLTDDEITTFNQMWQNKAKQREQEGWTFATALRIENTIKDSLFLVIVHERPKDQNNS